MISIIIVLIINHHCSDINHLHFHCLVVLKCFSNLKHTSKINHRHTDDCKA